MSRAKTHTNTQGLPLYLDKLQMIGSNLPFQSSTRMFAFYDGPGEHFHIEGMVVSIPNPSHSHMVIPIFIPEIYTL